MKGGRFVSGEVRGMGKRMSCYLWPVSGSECLVRGSWFLVLDAWGYPLLYDRSMRLNERSSHNVSSERILP